MDCNCRFLDFYLAYDFKLDIVSIGNQTYFLQLLFMQIHLTKIISVTYTSCLQHCLGKFYIPSMFVFSQFAYLIGKDQGFITAFICISRDMRDCFIFVRMCFVIR